MSSIIGIDVGTTTICGVAVGPAGELLASVEKPNDSAVSGLPSGWSEQDPARIRDRVFEVVRALVQKVDGVTCIGLTGQMHGMLCVDSANRPVSRLVTWQDGRCLVDLGGDTVLSQMLTQTPGDAWACCGCRPSSGFMGSTLFWMCQTAALPPEARRVSFIHDWIGGVLGGQLPVTDPSDAGSSGIFDLVKLNWHEEIIRTLRLPADLLPPVRESGEVIGAVSAEVASATGLKAGTPICNGIGDNQAGVLGSIAEPQRSVLVNLGTGGQISWSVPWFNRVEGMETRYLPYQRYMLVGASLCGGRAFAWLNDVVRAWLREFGHHADREHVFERLSALAAIGHVVEPLMARTTFAGTREDPSLRGTFENIGLNNFNLADVARAVLEGMVEELCAFYDWAGGSTKHDTVVASGNAVRKNPLLREIIGSRLTWRVLIPAHREEAAFGAALLAGVGAGVFKSLEEAGQCIRYEEVGR
jgi:sugar (pentulose or hexulose) kinase